MHVYPTGPPDARCAARGCRCGHRRPVYPSDMSDTEWDMLRPHAVEVMAQIRLAPGRPIEHPLRSMLDAVRYVVRNGIEWRALPVDFPPWSAVYAFSTNAGVPGICRCGFRIGCVTCYAIAAGVTGNPPRRSSTRRA